MSPSPSPLSVDVAGAGDPLVLLHGLATDRHIWDPVVPALAARHRVFTVDLPGFGQSAPVGEGYELGEVAERVIRGLTARRIERPFALVGHSLGAGVAVTIASLRPAAISRLVLVAPAGFHQLPGPAPALLAAGADAVFAARRMFAPLVDLPWGRRMLLSRVAADGATIAPSMARQMVNASAGASRTAAALETITAADLLPVLRRTDVPLCVIWGELDRAVPSSLASVIAQARPDADIRLLPDSGHVPMVECPEVFVAALEQLLGTD